MKTGANAICESVVTACASPLGITRAEVVEITGLTPRSVEKAMRRLNTFGKVVCHIVRHVAHYFKTYEQMVAALPLLEDLKSKQIDDAKMRRRERDRVRQLKTYPDWSEKKKEVVRANQRKNYVRAQPKELTQPKPMNSDQRARLAWAAQEAIIPPHVKVQVCPGFTGQSRYDDALHARIQQWARAPL